MKTKGRRRQFWKKNWKTKHVGKVKVKFSTSLYEKNKINKDHFKKKKKKKVHEKKKKSHVVNIVVIHNVLKKKTTELNFQSVQY